MLWILENFVFDFYHAKEWNKLTIGTNRIQTPIFIHLNITSHTVNAEYHIANIELLLDHIKYR